MRTFKKLIYFCAFTFSLASCADSDVHSPTEPYRQPASESSLQRACQSISQTEFEDSTQSCYCQAPGKFFAFYKGQPKCFSLVSSDVFGEPDISPVVDEAEEEESIWARLRDAFTGENEDPQDSPISTVPSDSVSGWVGPSTLVETFSPRPLRSRFRPVGVLNNPQAYSQSSVRIEVGTKYDINDYYVKNLLLFSAENVGLEHTETFVFKDSVTYEYAFTTKNPRYRDRSALRSLQGRQRLTHLMYVYQRWLEGQIPLTSKSGDCKSYCLLTYKSNLPNHSQRRVVIKLAKSMGANLRGLISLHDNNETLKEALQLSPSLHPAALVLVDHSKKDHEIFSEFKAYDIGGRLVGQHSTVVVDQNENRFLKRSLFEQPGNYDAKVALCDSGNLNTMMDFDPRLKDSMFLGPSRGSYLGWVDRAEPRNFNLYYSGLFEAYKNVLRDPNSHAQTVAVALKEAFSQNTYGYSKLKIAPLNVRTCYSHFNKVKANLSQAAVRVINYSVVHMEDRQSCRKSKIYQSILSSASSHLWVFGAGNLRGLKNPKDQYCPQELSGRSNMIVVTGEGYTTGSLYADILANSESDGNHGTSYAAPKVSAVAALIDRNYPGLKISSVRMAILVSANIQNLGYPANVRSGGRLNSKRALKAAQIIHQLQGTHSSEKALVKMTVRKLFRSYEANERLKLYKKNGLFSL